MAGNKSQHIYKCVYIVNNLSIIPGNTQMSGFRHFSHGVFAGCLFSGSLTYILTNLYIHTKYTLTPAQNIQMKINHKSPSPA